MSILGLGTDIVAVARMRDLLARHGERFEARCFTAAERETVAGRAPETRPAVLAARWAAKEAFVKALGGDIGHVPYGDVGVVNEPGGAPRLVLSGVAAEAARQRGVRRAHVSLSHEREHAVAVVLLED